MPQPGGITVESIYGAQTGAPLVVLTLQDADDPTTPLYTVQMPPAKARAIAFMFLEAAEAATSDAFLMRWSAQVYGEETPDQREQGLRMGAAMVHELRNYRELARRQGDDQEAADQAQWQAEHPDG